MSKAALDTWERICANRLVLADQLETLSEAQANGPSCALGGEFETSSGISSTLPSPP